jgi:hypothetical protein
MTTSWRYVWHLPHLDAMANHQMGVAYRDLRRQGDSVIVEADLLYVDTRFPKAHKHRAVARRNQLELRLVGDRWYVREVQFPKNRSLVALKAYIQDGLRSCSKP